LGLIGFVLGLGVIFGGKNGFVLGLNWVCLALFFGGIVIFSAKTHKIGFVLHIYLRSVAAVGLKNWLIFNSYFHK
jgi:hypothetical protein